MAKTFVIVLIIAAIVIIGIILAAVLMMNTNNPPAKNPPITNPPASNPPANNPPVNNPPATPRTYNINIKSFAFSPSTLTIKKGDTVIWTNSDSAPHTVTSDSGSEISSQSLSTGKTYSHTFNTAGTFNYHCTIHPSMKANVIVQ